MDLVAAFKTLGVSEPDSWAASQEREGIDQLTRATALRAFADAVNQAPAHWTALARTGSTPEVKASALKLQEMGLPAEDLERVLKATVSDVMFHVCALLDGSAVPEINPGEVMVGAFAVKEVGDDFVPSPDSLGLHESWNEVAARVLGADVIRA